MVVKICLSSYSLIPDEKICFTSRKINLSLDEIFFNLSLLNNAISSPTETSNFFAKADPMKTEFLLIFK